MVEAARVIVGVRGYDSHPFALSRVWYCGHVRVDNGRHICWLRLHHDGPHRCADHVVLLCEPWETPVQELVNEFMALT